MSFSIILSGLGLTTMIFVVSAIFGAITQFISDDDDSFPPATWTFCAFGFAIRLTLLLVEKGVLR